MRPHGSKPKNRRRRWLKWLGGAAVLCGAALLALPLWWPWVLVPVLRNQGVRVGDYERQGISRLALNDVAFTNNHVEVTAESLVMQLPQEWLRDRFRSATNTVGPPQLALANWRVRVLASNPKNSPPSTNSLPSVIDQTEAVIRAARPWVRLAGATNGLVVLGKRTITLPSIKIGRDDLEVLATDEESRLSASMSLDWAATNSFQLRANAPQIDASGTLRIARTNQTWTANGHILWQTNLALIQVGLDRTGWWPATMSLVATNVNIPSATLGLAGYQSLTGNFDVTWTNRQYHFAIQGDAQPVQDNPLVPDMIQIDMAGQGNLEALAIERLNISTPAIRAQLSDPLAIDFSGKMLVPEAKLQVNADFDEKAGLPFQGQLDGVVTARPDRNAMINAGFDVHVNQFASPLLSVDRVNLMGALHWPQLVVSNAFFSFPNAGTFRLNGGLDLLSRAATNVNWTFHGALPTNFVPQGLAIESVAARGQASGTWPDFQQQTEVQLTQPTWNGAQAENLSVRLAGTTRGTNDWRLRVNRSDVHFDGSGAINLGALTNSDLSATISKLQLTLNTNESLALDRAVDLELNWATNATRQFAAQVSPLRLASTNKQLELSADIAWPGSGGVTLSATNIATSDLSALWPRDWPTVSLRDLALTAGWDHSPLIFSALGDVSCETPLAGKVDAHVRINANANGMEFSPVNVGVDGQELLAVSGRLPMKILPAESSALQWIEKGTIDAKLNSVGDNPFWNRLAKRGGVSVSGPEIKLNAQGSPEDFQAQLSLVAASIHPLQLTNLPSDFAVVSNLHLHAEADRQMIRLTDGGFAIAGQPGKITAELPVAASSWADWLRALRQVDWKNATGSVAVPKIEIAALTPLTGSTLAPTGQAELQLTLKKGGNFQGFVMVTNLSTKSLPTVGAVRDIASRIEFNDHEAEIKSFVATLSGQPVRAGGRAEWNTQGLTKADLFLNATNLSLVRSPSLFLRGDLDLRLVADGKTSPTINGDVILNNSLLFQDIAQLVQIDLRRPERRPPFFSVPNPPFADWQLDVRVRGQKFLRVLSPVFKGQVSSGLQLTGTLQEPVALGEVSIDKGQMLFPFGTLDVTHGTVQLTREHPYQPQVDFHGQGLNFGYNITVDVTGNADAPNVTFSSVPPLSTREIMLMLTAGDVPSGAYSYSNLDKASKLGYFLGKQLITQLLGLDTGEDRLIFRTGEYVTDDGQLTYRIEYKLIDWLSIFGEYTRFRDYNGGLKFNIYSR